MPSVKLDSFFVQTAFCPEGKSKIDYYDSAITGFILEVRESGGRTYSLRYRDKHGRQRQFKIGNAADITFDKAKKEAIRIRSRVVVGENPAEVREITRRIPTVAELADRYLEHVRTYKRSHAIDERYLRNHLVPKYGKMHLDELEQTEVVDWLRSKVIGGYAQATVNRWQVILCHMYKLGKRWGVPGTDKNPLEGVQQLPCNNEKERYLTVDETRRLQKAVEASPNPQLKHIVALLLLTGRKRELLDAQWEEFHLDRRSWRIPMSKSGKARFVPLPKAALDVLAQLPRWEGCPYVVPNPKTRKPFHSIFNSWNRARQQAGLSDVRVHDLRHSAASNMVNAGQSLYVVGSVLGHSQTRTTQRYAHLSSDTLLAAVDAAADAMGTTWAQPATPASETPAPAGA
jgi:integrase